MRKLFLFCLLASFALATNSFAGPKKAVTFLGDGGGDWGTPGTTSGAQFDTDYNPGCDTSTFNLHSCPNNAICNACKDNYGEHYQMTGCKSGYGRVGNKCIKKATGKITNTKNKIDGVIKSKTVTTKRKK